MKTKKQPVRAKEWQASTLKKMHEEIARPSAAQRHQLAMETGLDEAWIKNWFKRRNKNTRPVSLNRGGPAPPRPEKLLIHKIKLDLLAPEDSIRSDASRSLSPTPAHPVLSQETSDTSPALDVLLASLNGQADEDCSACILAPTYSFPSSTNNLSFGYIPEVPLIIGARSNSRSPSSSYSSLGEEPSISWMQPALPQSSTKWPYSRDPLHNRYPDFSKFFLATPPYDAFDAAEPLELSPMAVSSLVHIPSSLLGIECTGQYPDYIPPTMQFHSSIALPVSCPARLPQFSPMHNQEAAQAPDVAQDSPSSCL